MDVPDEACILILEYLRSLDLATCRETSKCIFTKFRIQKAIKYQLSNIYSTYSFLNYSSIKSPAVELREEDYRCDLLYG